MAPSSGGWRYLLAGPIAIFVLNPAAVLGLDSPMDGFVFIGFGARLGLLGIYRFPT